MDRGLPYDAIFGEREAALKVTFLTGLALLLRYLWFDAQPLWTDEAITWEFAKTDFGGLLLRQLYDASPPGFYLLLKAWLGLARSNEEMRWLTVLLGAATVPATYLLGARLKNRAAGLLGAWLVAINPLHFYYSLEVRYPVLLTLLLTLQILLFGECLRDGARRRWIAWSAVTALALWVQYFTGFVVLAEVVYLLLDRERRRSTGRLAVSLLAVALLFLPWWTEFTLQLTRGKPTRQFFGWFERLFLGPAFLTLGGSEWSLPSLLGRLPDDRGYLAVALLLMAPFAVALGLGIRREKQERSRYQLTFIVAATFVAFLAAAQFLPLFRPKYLLPLLPPAAVLAGDGLSRLAGRRRWAAWLLFLAISAVSLHGVAAVATDPLLGKEPWREVADRLGRDGREGDVIAVPNRYYALALELAVADRWPIVSIVGDSPYEQLARPDQVARIARRLFARAERVWYIDHDWRLFDPREVVPATLGEIGREATRLVYPRGRHFSLRLFARDEAAARDSRSGVVDFQTGDYTPEQSLDGWSPGPPGFRWLSESAAVRVTRRWGEDLAFACFYVHRPYFTDGPPTFRLWVDEQEVAARRVDESDLICLEGMLGPAARERREVVLRLTTDRTFVPAAVRGDGDRTPRSALAARLGLHRTGFCWEKP